MEQIRQGDILLKRIDRIEGKLVGTYNLIVET